MEFGLPSWFCIIILCFICRLLSTGAVDMVRLAKTKYLVGISGAVAILLILLMSNFSLPSRNAGTDYLKSDLSSEVSPIVTSVIPEGSFADAKDITVTPEYTTVSKFTATNAEFLFPLLMPAYGITSSQTVVTSTEWAIPTAGSNPIGITDTSGNIFFTESNKIGRLVPSTNVITEWTIPTASSNARGIATDTSGNIFFTEQGGNKIGRLS